MSQREIVPTYRVLTEVLYDIDFLFIKLTIFELAIVLGVFAIVIIVYTYSGLNNIPIFGIKLDGSIAALIVSAILVLVISIIHIINPEISIENYIKGVASPTKWIGRTKSKEWVPSIELGSK